MDTCMLLKHAQYVPAHSMNVKHEGSYESWIRSLNDASEYCSLFVCQALNPAAKLS